MQIVTILGMDGTLTTIPSLPHKLRALERLTAPRVDRSPLPTGEEQGLVVGSIFTISATNGLEPTRRINLLGFCQSIDYLFETVEETVVMWGGEVFETERQLKRWARWEVMCVCTCHP